MKECKLLLFDLDGTLLQSDKTISTRTLSALKKMQGNDILIGVSTSRSEQNSLVFLNELMPDILISSGGALVKYKTEYIYRAEFSEEETNVMIDMARNICGNDCEITIDTIDAHYWNYKIDPKKLDKSWGDSIYTDFSDFNECSLKMCVEIFNQDKADKLARSLSDCDCIRFSDGFWYKFTKKNVTKENAIMKITEVCGFSTDSIIAFGDDYVDIGMLELCGTGVAMGNAIDEVKEREMRSELLCVQSFFSRDDWYGICGVWQSDSHTTHGGAVDLQRYVSGGDFAGCGDEFCKLLHSFI